jgi:RibD domain-containing protein
MDLTRRQLLRGAAVMGRSAARFGHVPAVRDELLGRRTGAAAWLPAMADPDHVLTYLREAFGHFDTADWLFGPQLLLPTVDAHLALVQQLLSAATGPVRADLLTVGTRYAEFASWVNQDGGNMPAAGRWADLALESAHEAKDSAMVSYVLMRKSSRAAVEGDTGRTIGLAQVAQQQASHVPARIRAVAAQQEAHGHALAGDEASCHRKLDEAMELAAKELTVEGPGRYCIPEFLEIQRATCRPFVLWKFGASLDGRLAAADGSSQWITSEESRTDAHRLRAESDAVMVGSGTQRIDNPHLAVRHVEADRQRLPNRCGYPGSHSCRCTRGRRCGADPDRRRRGC